MKRLLLLLASILLLSACAAGGGAKRNMTPEEYISARANERWDHIIQKRYKEAYEYLTPGERQTTTMEAYATRLLSTQVFWSAAEVVSAKCDEPERCLVDVRITFDVKSPVPNVETLGAQQIIHEAWLKSGSDWYFLPRK